MNKESISLGIIGLLVGVLLGGSVIALTQNNSQPTARQITSHSDMSMNAMTEELEDITGDDFDKAFIEMMIAHHQGAIDMAEMVPGRAKHDEIKTLGEAIISAQTQEISDMYKWQAAWGYRREEMMQDMHGR